MQIFFFKLLLLIWDKSWLLIKNPADLSLFCIWFSKFLAHVKFSVSVLLPLTSILWANSAPILKDEKLFESKWAKAENNVLNFL